MDTSCCMLQVSDIDQLLQGKSGFRFSLFCSESPAAKTSRFEVCSYLIQNVYVCDSTSGRTQYTPYNYNISRNQYVVKVAVEGAEPTHL